MRKDVKEHIKSPTKFTRKKSNRPRKPNFGFSGPFALFLSKIHILDILKKCDSFILWL